MASIVNHGNLEFDEWYLWQRMPLQVQNDRLEYDENGIIAGERRYRSSQDALALVVIGGGDSGSGGGGEGGGGRGEKIKWRKMEAASRKQVLQCKSLEWLIADIDLIFSDVF